MIQQKLYKILQSEHQIAKLQLSNIDSALTELVANASKNKGKKGGARSYSDNIKIFAFTMYYYSPKAFKYIQSTFQLPSPRTINRWLETVEVEPGFLTKILEMVSHKHGDAPFSLVIDSMAIRKRVINDKQSGKILGNIDYGNGIHNDAEKNTQATEALVFLLVSLTTRERYPTAFFFVDKIQSVVQKQLITQCLSLAAEKGVNITNITCDGAPSNITTLRKLGAAISTSSQSFFLHPTKKHKVCLNNRVLVYLCCQILV